MWSCHFRLVPLIFSAKFGKTIKAASRLQKAPSSLLARNILLWNIIISEGSCPMVQWTYSQLVRWSRQRTFSPSHLMAPSLHTCGKSYAAGNYFHAIILFFYNSFQGDRSKHLSFRGSVRIRDRGNRQETSQGTSCLFVPKRSKFRTFTFLNFESFIWNRK